jgi:hypothetical protein
MHNAQATSILADAEPAEWLAMLTKWLASQSARRGWLIPPKSMPHPKKAIWRGRKPL